MKKVLLIILLIPFLSNCSQYTAMVGPTITLAETGSVLQATTSLSSSLAMNNAKKNIIAEINSQNICPTIHSSELTEIFFETLEQMDCEYDPMSIYR
jgi:PBP1b-binding outer membrane lipoprotein LpoB|tara:strand:- start:132 stop:422 length:291 start_codon:yes stop_codon:yes gene_type:complete